MKPLTEAVTEAVRLRLSQSQRRAEPGVRLNLTRTWSQQKRPPASCAASRRAGQRWLGQRPGAGERQGLEGGRDPGLGLEIEGSAGENFGRYATRPLKIMPGNNSNK